MSNNDINLPYHLIPNNYYPKNLTQNQNLPKNHYQPDHLQPNQQSNQSNYQNDYQNQYQNKYLVDHLQSSHQQNQNQIQNQNKYLLDHLQPSQSILSNQHHINHDTLNHHSHNYHLNNSLNSNHIPNHIPNHNQTDNHNHHHNHNHHDIIHQNLIQSPYDYQFQGIKDQIGNHGSSGNQNRLGSQSSLPNQNSISNVSSQGDRDSSQNQPHYQNQSNQYHSQSYFQSNLHQNHPNLYQSNQYQPNKYQYPQDSLGNANQPPYPSSPQNSNTPQMLPNPNSGPTLRPIKQNQNFQNFQTQNYPIPEDYRTQSAISLDPQYSNHPPVTRKPPSDFNQLNKSASSLTYENTNNYGPRNQSLTSSSSFAYPIDQYNRKAPKKTMQNPETRRVVSSPLLPEYNPNTSVNQESRTKSLTSGSGKFQNKSPSQLQINNSMSNPNSRPNLQTNTITSNHSLSSRSRSFTSISKLSSLSTKKFSSSSNLNNGNNSNKIDRVPSVGTASKHLAFNYSSSTLRKPLVYPAILSQVAKLFRESIILTINTKDGLEYHDTFTGKMAVDIICRIIRTNDRNLALLLGRSLDAQKFFHDVSYQHRLRDSVHEVFSFSHNYNDMEFYQEDNLSSAKNSANNSRHGSFIDPHIQELTSNASTLVGTQSSKVSPSEATGVNGVFTILTDCYSPTCTRNRLCYSIACPRRLEQQARLNLKPQGGLRRAVSRLSLQEKDEVKTLWHETVPQSILDKLDKQEKMRQELIYEFIYTERDYVKDLEFMTDFYIMPLRNPANNIIPENQRETFIHTVFGGVGDLLRLAKSMSEALTRRQQLQKPVIETFADVFLDYVGSFDPFIRYSGNKVFASFEHERQQQVNMKYARFLDAIEKKPESRKQDLSSFLIKGVQRPARYQLLLNGIIKNTKPTSPDYKNLLKAKEEIEKILVKINVQTGESTDRHKVMVLHRLLGKQTLENRYNFKLNYNNRIIYQVTLNRKRDNEKIDLYLFEHALLLVKHKIQNKREQHKVFEKPIYLSLLFINSGIEIPNVRTLMNHRYRMSLLSDTSIRNRIETSNYIGTSSNSNAKYQINFLGLGSNQVHASLYAEDVTVQNQVLQQVYNQQKKLIEKHDMFSLTKYETRKFHGSNKINCAVPCYGGKKLLYGTDTGLWLSTVRTISMKSNEKIVSDPTLVISKVYVTQIEVLVEYSKLLVLADKILYEFDLSCTDSLDHVKNTKSGKVLAHNISFFKTGICDGKLIVCGGKVATHSVVIFEPTNPFDKNPKNKNRRIEIQEITFSSDPISISFLKTKVCVGCSKGWEILSLETGKKEPILDEADPSLDFAIQKETVKPLAIHRLDKEFMLCYSEFVFLINRNGWRISHDWFINWEGNPQNLAYFFPYILSFDPGFIEIRNLHTTNIERTLIGENIRFLHANEHEAMYACEENGYDIIVAIDFLNLKPRES